MGGYANHDKEQSDGCIRPAATCFMNLAAETKLTILFWVISVDLNWQILKSSLTVQNRRHTNVSSRFSTILLAVWETESRKNNKTFVSWSTDWNGWKPLRDDSSKRSATIRSCRAPCLHSRTGLIAVQEVQVRSGTIKENISPFIVVSAWIGALNFQLGRTPIWEYPVVVLHFPALLLLGK